MPVKPCPSFFFLRVRQEVALESPVGDFTPQVGARLIRAPIMDSSPDARIDDFFREVVGSGVIPVRNAGKCARDGQADVLRAQEICEYLCL